MFSHQPLAQMCFFSFRVKLIPSPCLQGDWNRAAELVSGSQGLPCTSAGGCFYEPEGWIGEMHMELHVWANTFWKLKPIKVWGVQSQLRKTYHGFEKSIKACSLIMNKMGPSMAPRDVRQQKTHGGAEFIASKNKESSCKMFAVKNRKKISQFALLARDRS